MNKYFIPLTIPSAEFDRHISLKDNSRILFSGPFGIGKSTFINNYFAENKKYTPVILRPVNYTVASNEDIYKLIKYDILYKLIDATHVEVEGVEAFTNLETITHFLQTAELKLFLPFIKIIPEIGGTVAEILPGLERFYTSYKTFKSGVTENFAQKAILQFISELENEHYLLENDFISDIIKSTISNINSNEKEGGAILIIDDLDRIDPEHIFRLFNIFSTHFNSVNESDNKFGFHRIIFICDIVNIRSIFKTKYGFETDFNGYIDKFYTSQIFKYNNKYAIAEFIRKSVPFYQYSSMVKPKDINFLIEILTAMLELGVTNLRNLKKARYKMPKEEEFHNDEEIFNRKALESTDFGRFYFTKVVMILKYIVGDMNTLCEHIDNCRKIINKSNKKHVGIDQTRESDYLTTYLIPVLEHQRMKLGQGYSFNFKNNLKDFTYEFVNENMHTYTKALEPVVLPPGLFWDILYEAVKALKDHEIID